MGFEEFFGSNDMWNGIFVESVGVAIELGILFALVPIFIWLQRRKMKAAFFPLSSMIVVKTHEDIISEIIAVLGAQGHIAGKNQPDQAISHMIYGYLHKNYDAIIEYTNQIEGGLIKIDKEQWDQFIEKTDRVIFGLNQVNLVINPLKDWSYHMVNLQVLFLGLKSRAIYIEGRNDISLAKDAFHPLIYYLKAQFKDLKKPLDTMDTIHRHQLSQKSAFERWVRLRNLKKNGLTDMFRMD